MGKGDKRTRKGKITISSYGNTRNKKTNKAITPKERKQNGETKKNG